METQGVRVAEGGSRSLVVTGLGFDPKSLAAKHTTIPRWTPMQSPSSGTQKRYGNLSG